MYLLIFSFELLLQDKILIKSTHCDYDATSSLPDNQISLLAFSDFTKASLKTTKDLTVREIFMKQLLQLRFLSLDKAQAITQMFPTPRSLFLAYRKCTNKAVAEKLLSNLQCGTLKRNLGLNISKTLYQLYSNENVS
jgi:crossover junction endonuclease MUS81